MNQIDRRLEAGLNKQIDSAATSSELTPDQRPLIERLFCSYRTELVGYLRRKYRRESACAEDIAQDAFLRLQRLESLKDIENPRAHLYKTASNLAIDHQRREQSRNKYIEIVEQESDMEQSSSHSPQRHVQGERQVEALQQAINQLPDNCRRAFLLHRIHGHSYSEIALELGVSVSSVEKYIVKALLACRSIQEDA